MSRKTGAGAARTMDTIGVTHVATVLLSLAVVGGAIGSVEGLVHAGSWAEPAELQWTLPLAVDVFLVGTALATLQLRERRAYAAAIFCAVVTLALVSFSAVTNFTYVRSVSEPGSEAYEFGAYIKGSMPVLLLLALEIIAALKSTRNNRAMSPLNTAKRKLAAANKRVRVLEAAQKPPRPWTRRTKPDVTDAATVAAFAQQTAVPSSTVAAIETSGPERPVQVQRGEILAPAGEGVEA